MRTSPLAAPLAIALALAGAHPARGSAGSPPVLPPADPPDIERIDGALPATATAQPASPRRALVFWKCEGFFHRDGIVYGNEAIARAGARTGAYTSDATDDYAALRAENLARYDVLILNNTTRLKIVDPALRQGILDFVQAGKGLVGIHAASDNFYDWPEGARLVGALFDGHPWGAGGTWAFKPDAPDHPLARAFQGAGFRLKDEIYQFKAPYTRADRTVLLSLDLDDEATGKVAREGKGVKRVDKDFAVAWIRDEGRGRVFYCGLGHNREVFLAPHVLRFLLDGIQYATGDLRF